MATQIFGHNIINIYGIWEELEILLNGKLEKMQARLFQILYLATVIRRHTEELVVIVKHKKLEQKHNKLERMLKWNAFKHKSQNKKRMI